MCRIHVVKTRMTRVLELEEVDSTALGRVAALRLTDKRCPAIGMRLTRAVRLRMWCSSCGPTSLIWIRKSSRCNTGLSAVAVDAAGPSAFSPIARS